MWRFGLEEWAVWIGGMEGLSKERKKVQMGGQRGWAGTGGCINRERR